MRDIGLRGRRRMAGQTASFSVCGFESELLSHPQRRLIEEHVVGSPMRDVASQPSRRFATDQRTTAMTARGGTTGDTDQSIRHWIFRRQIGRCHSDHADSNQEAWLEYEYQVVWRSS